MTEADRAKVDKIKQWVEGCKDRKQVEMLMLTSDIAMLLAKLLESEEWRTSRERADREFLQLAADIVFGRDVPVYCRVEELAL